MANEIFLKQIVKEFLASKYFKDISGQAGLLIVAQMIPIVFSPLLSRLYDENAMAEITGLMSISSLLLVLSTLKMENAIIVEKSERKARQLLGLCIVIAFIFMVLLLVFSVFFGSFLIHVFKIKSVIYYLPFYILSFSLLNILNFWFVRIKKFEMKAYSKILENLGYVLFAVILYFFFGENNFGLALGKIFGIGIALILLVFFSKIGYKHLFSNIAYRELMIHYKEFPLHNTPSSFINVISLQMLVIFVGTFFSKEQLGYFGLANMVVLLPVSFVAQSVGSIFFQKMSEQLNLGNSKNAKKIFFQTLGMLIIIALPVFLILFFGSKWLFPLIFGSNWKVTGEIAQLLAIVFLFQVVVSPISIVLVPLKRIKLNAYWQYGRFVFMTCFLMGLIYIAKTDFLDFLRWYGFGTAFTYFVYMIIILVQIQKLGNSSFVSR